MRRLSSVVFALGLVVTLVSCSGDDDDGIGLGEASSSSSSDADSSAPDEAADEALESAGDAEAAQGAGLDEPPGPANREPFSDLGEVAIAIRDADGNVVGWCVLTAETLEQRQQGLMEVTDLQGYAGMLFVWDEDTSGGFWMRNTVMPLSIAWFDEAGELVDTADMEPCPDSAADCPTYEPDGSYRFALEVPQGRLDDLGVEEGSTLKVGGPCAASDSG